MKKEEINYFETFMKNSNYALEASKILKDFIYNFDTKKTIEIENAVHNIENEADKSQHTILNYLIKDFLPPIDREDIIRLSHRIDDTVDSIDEIVINLNILDVEILRDDVKEFIDLLQTCCENLNEMFCRFKNMKKFDDIKEKVIVVNKIEEEGDMLYQKAIKKLYKENDPIEIIKWTTLYNCLEECFDSCEGVADCVEEILMKNS